MSYHFSGAARYQLTIHGLKLALPVQRFASTAQHLNKPYDYTIRLELPQTVSSSALVDQTATLSYGDGVKTMNIFGFIDKPKQLLEQQKRYVELLLCSPLFALDRLKQNRVFVNQKLTDIVTAILSAVAQNVTVDWHNVENVILPYKAQFEETNLNFLHRLLAQHQIAYTCSQNDTGITLHCFHNINDVGLPSFTLSYAELSGMERLNESAFNFKAQKTHATPGTYHLNTDAVDITVGAIVNLSQHPNREYNKSYRIHSLEARGERHDSTAATELPYQAKLVLTELIEDSELPSYIKVKMPYQTLGALESLNEQAELSRIGYVRIKQPFDALSRPKGQSSLEVAWLQSYGSNSMGMSHPHTDGSTIILDYQKEDLEHPMSIGAASGSISSSVVSDANAADYLLQSHTGHYFNFADTPDSSEIALLSKATSNQLQMQSDTKHLTLEAKGIMGMQSVQNLQRSIGASNTQTVSGQTTLASQTHSVASQSDVEQYAQGASSLITQQTLLAGALNQDLQKIFDAASTIQAKGITAASQRTMSQHGHHLTGNVTQESLFSTQNLITLKSGDSALQISGDGVFITAKNTILNAPNINPNAGNVSHNAGSAASPLTATAQNQLSNGSLSTKTLFGGSSAVAKTSLPSQQLDELSDPFSGLSNLFAEPNLDATPQTDEDEFKLFVATVYGEAGNTPLAWEPVADTIMTRAHNKKENIRKVISARHQFTCYIEPETVNWDDIEQHGLYWNEHGEFLKAYAYQSGKKINQQAAMTRYEQDIVRQIRYDLRRYYNGKVSYKITNYYSPRSQKELAKKYPDRYSEIPQFLKDIEEPWRYQVHIDGVDEERFKFYNLEQGG